MCTMSTSIFEFLLRGLGSEESAWSRKKEPLGECGRLNATHVKGHASRPWAQRGTAPSNWNEV